VSAARVSARRGATPSARAAWKGRALRVLVAIVCGASIVAPVGAAHADTPPSVWEKARDPNARARWNLHVRVRELIALDTQVGVQSLRAAALERARAMLEDAGAASSPDVRLRFDLGEVYEALGHHERAVDVLSQALEMAPDHPAASDATVTLAFAYAKLGRQRDERDTYVKVLARVTDDRARATALLNLAEAEMHLGNLEDAVAGYREAVQIAASIPTSLAASETGILAVWGLAVALDRSGDPHGALEQAKLATRMDPGEVLIGHGPNVFFVPAYERLWYLGLASVAHASEASDPRAAASHWGRAEAIWSAYLANAMSTDRWVPLARAHKERARVRKREAERRIDKAPRAPAERPDGPLVPY
jgi:tetratricopeptide (TPR) repeat protein